MNIPFIIITNDLYGQPLMDTIIDSGRIGSYLINFLSNDLGLALLLFQTSLSLTPELYELRKQLLFYTYQLPWFVINEYYDNIVTNNHLLQDISISSIRGEIERYFLKNIEKLQHNPQILILTSLYQNRLDKIKEYFSEQWKIGKKIIPLYEIYVPFDKLFYSGVEYDLYAFISLPLIQVLLNIVVYNYQNNTYIVHILSEDELRFLISNKNKDELDIFIKKFYLNKSNFISWFNNNRSDPSCSAAARLEWWLN